MIGRRLILIGFCLIMLILAAIPVGAATVPKTIYVSTTGNDNWYGTYEKPYKTITKAIGKALAGDTICLRGGAYYEKITISNKQGTSSAWITIKPYGSEKPIIDNSGMTYYPYDGIFLFKNTCKYIRITGLEIKNTRGHGIFLYGSYVDSIKIDNCIIHDCESSGIYCYNARNVEFCYNTVYCVNEGRSYGVSGSSPQEAVSFSGVQGFNIHHNIIYKYGKEGIDCKSGSSYGEIHHNEITTSLDSSFYLSTWHHYGIYIDGFTRTCQSIKIYNNRISGYGGSGIVIGAEEGGAIKDINIYNNTIDISYNSGFLRYNGIESFDNCHWTNIYIYSNTVTSKSGNSAIRVYPYAYNINNLVIKDNTFITTGYYSIYFQYTKSTETSGKITLSGNHYYRIGYNPHNRWLNGDDKYWGTNYIKGIY